MVDIWKRLLLCSLMENTKIKLFKQNHVAVDMGLTSLSRLLWRLMKQSCFNLHLTTLPPALMESVISAAYIFDPMRWTVEDSSLKNTPRLAEIQTLDSQFAKQIAPHHGGSTKAIVAEAEEEWEKFFTVSSEAESKVV